jgi:hypothetical protein
VRPDAIGQILACPKCGSFILIEAPASIEAAAAVEDTGFANAGPVAVATAIEVIPKAAPLAVAETPSIVSNDIVTAQSGPTLQVAVHETPAPPRSAIRAESQRWPRWFLPSASAILVAALVAVVVRITLHHDASEPTVIVTTNYGSEVPARSVTANDKQAIPTVEQEKEKPTVPADANVATDSNANKQTTDNRDGMTAAPTEQASKANETVADSPPVGSSEDKAETMPAAGPPAISAAATQAHDELVIRPADRTNQAAPPAAAPPNAAAAGAPHSPPAIPAARSLARVSARRAHVEDRLADPVAGFEVSKMPLWQFVDVVSELSSIPITLDARALSNLGVSPATPIDVRLEKTTVSGILEAALNPLKLSWQSDDGQLVVGYAPQQNLREVRYAIGDLAGDPQAVADLAALVRQMVAPQTWREAGGKASLIAASDTLVVEQSEPVHFELLAFCEKLRVARGKPIRSRFDPSRFSLTTQTQKAHALLRTEITVNFASPRPLSDVITWMRPKIPGALLIDHAALAREEMSAESDCSVVAVNKPLSALLDGLVASADLAWRAIDERTVELTTRQAAADQMDVEFYGVRDLAADGTAADAIVRRVTAEIEPRIWGNDPAKAAIHYDPAGRTLIVRAPQKTQMQVESLLADIRGKK